MCMWIYISRVCVCNTYIFVYVYIYIYIVLTHTHMYIYTYVYTCAYKAINACVPYSHAYINVANI